MERNKATACTELCRSEPNGAKNSKFTELAEVNLPKGEPERVKYNDKTFSKAAACTELAEVSLPKGETEKVECKDESFSKVPEPAEGTI